MLYKIKNIKLNQTMIVDEISDYLFQEGWRFVCEVKSAEVCPHELDETKRQIAIEQHGF